MKFSSYLFILFTIILHACHKEKKRTGRVNPNDTICLKEIEEANTDLKKSKLVYCHYTGNILWESLRSEDEMKNLLKKYYIEFRNESSSCIIDSKLKYHCYCEIMEEEINEKYGKKFIKSLLYKADSLWVLKNIDKTFEMGGTNGAWDQCALFPGDKYYNESNHSAIQEAFDKQITYAENYKSKSHQYSIPMQLFMQMFLLIKMAKQR